jgi:hypothetical protein
MIFRAGRRRETDFIEGRMIEGSEGFVMNGRGGLMTSFRARDDTL